MMLNIGEIRRARELGYKGRALYVWYDCPVCGKARWMLKSRKGTLCQPCAVQKLARERKPITYSGIGDPRLGDTIIAKTLGYAGNGIRYYDACPSCSRKRWVRPLSIGSLCVHCVPKIKGQHHFRWSGGRKTKKGYIYVVITKGDPYWCMSKNGWILEHRLVVARDIGRILGRAEVVHHINGNKSDNRIVNLLLLEEKNHNSHLVLKDFQIRMRNIEDRVTQLEVDNVLLRHILQEVRDNVPESNSILQRYNTPSSCVETTEGIVQPSSNRGEDIESA